MAETPGPRSGRAGAPSAPEFNRQARHPAATVNQVISDFRLLRILLTAVAILWPAGATSAQQGQPPARPTRVPVSLALVDSARTGDAPYRILRRADVAPHDVILLRSGSDAAVLSEAVGNLLLIRAQTGDTARVNGVMRVQRARGAPGRAPRVLPWAGRVLNDLQLAPAREVPGVGSVPAVEIWLPPQRGRKP